jgi:hypothetical protein
MSACSAILMRLGSTTTILAPSRRAALRIGVRWRFDHVTLLPQAIASFECRTCSGAMPGVVPKVPSQAWVRMPPQSGERSRSEAPSLWKKRRSMEAYASIPCGPA